VIHCFLKSIVSFILTFLDSDQTPSDHLHAHYCSGQLGIKESLSCLGMLQSTLVQIFYHLHSFKGLVSPRNGAYPMPPANKSLLEHLRGRQWTIHCCAFLVGNYLGEKQAIRQPETNKVVDFSPTLDLLLIFGLSVDGDGSRKGEEGREDQDGVIPLREVS